MTALIYVASGLLGASVVGVVFVAVVMVAQAWDRVTGDDVCDRRR